MSELQVASEIPTLADIDDLPEEALARVNSLFQSMTSNPAGFEGGVKWQPEKLKIRHPVSSDPMMPQDAEFGDLYANGRVLWGEKEGGRSEPLEFVLCYAWQSRARFQPGDNRPDCTSADSTWNDFGTLKCDNCPDLPFRNGKPTNCQNTLNMVILPVDLSGVYIVRFSKSSHKAGRNIRRMLGGCKNTFDRRFGLFTEQMSNGKKKWYVYKTIASEGDVPPEVAAFADYVGKAYKDIRTEFLESLKEMRENAAEGLQAMDSIGEDLDDTDGFDDTM